MDCHIHGIGNSGEEIYTAATFQSALHSMNYLIENHPFKTMLVAILSAACTLIFLF